MSKEFSIQAQTVLYHNDTKMLLRSFESLLNSYMVSKEQGGLPTGLCIRYGDASLEPLFSAEEVKGFADLCPEGCEFYYTYFDENTGTARGHNLLAQDARTDYLFLMNPDVVATPLLFKHLLAPFLDTSRNAGQVEARQTPIEHPKSYDLATGETYWASGAGSLLPSSVFEEVGCYDEDSFFMYCDDVDLSARIRLLGKSIIYQPQAVMYHAKSLSNQADWQPTSAEKYYSAEAGLMMAYKWSNTRRFHDLMYSFSKSDNPDFIRAAETIVEKVKNNNMPKQIDPGTKIPIFFDGEGVYAPHRFSL